MNIRLQRMRSEKHSSGPVQTSSSKTYTIRGIDYGNEVGINSICIEIIEHNRPRFHPVSCIVYRQIA